MDDLYQEELLEHYRHPGNYGRIESANVHYKDYNPVCGDEIEIFARVDGGRVANISFTGKGCAISQAAASILTGRIKGQDIKVALKVTNDEMLGLLPIKVSYMRTKCALLALKAFQKGMIRWQSSK